MRLVFALFCVAVLSQSVVGWFGAEAETTTTEQPATTTQPAETETTTTATEGTAKEASEAVHAGESVAEETETFHEGEQPEAAEGDAATQEENPLDSVDFYMYTVKDMSGNDFSLEAYRGYVTLVVNVASNCGYTDAGYKDLVALQTKFEPTGAFTVLAFPCNQFWEQEPGTNEDILRFATEKYTANFPIFGKTDVHGDNATDAYQYLAQVTGYAPQWNFWKYLVDQNGRVIDVWSHETAAIELEGWIEDAISKALAQAEGSFVGEGYPDYETGNETSHAHHEHGDEL